MQQRKPTRPRLHEALDWDDVRLFLALSRARTVGSAAKKLGIDASTVSRRLAALEGALGVTLFDRSRDGITKTLPAEDLLTVAEEIEAGMTRFTHAADGLEREVAGTVRLTCPPDIAEQLVAPLLPSLFTQHPLLRVELAPGEAVLDLTRREADLALRIVRPVRGDLVVTRAATVPWVLVASPRYVRRLGTLRAWQDASWISWGDRLSNIGPARWFSTHVRNTTPVVRSDSLTFQMAALQNHVGVALVPALSMRSYGLSPVKLSPALREAARVWPVDELFLVTHRALRDVPRVRVVWDLLLEHIGQQDQRTSARKRAAR